LSLSKLQHHIYIFRNRRQFRTALEQQLWAVSIKQRLLILDMPIWWNSTYEMLSIAYLQEALITAVCATQRIDISVQDIMLTPQDWELLQEIINLFEIFVHPSRKLQGSTYLTLNYDMLQYYIMIKKLKEKRQV
jgi:hypothetical protein